MKIQIAPSLLAGDLGKIGEEVRALDAAGADIIHFDVMDGHFVPNLTFGAPVMESVRKLSKLPFDAHLMVTNPDAHLERFAQAGCNWLSVHVEVCHHLNRTLNRIKELGMKAGVAINPGTSLATLDAALPDADYVLVMSVNPGFGGQSFIPSALDKVRELKKKIGKGSTLIQIDGGIKDHTIHEVAQAGAQIMVVGTGITAAPDYKKAIQTLREKAEGRT